MKRYIFMTSIAAVLTAAFLYFTDSYVLFNIAYIASFVFIMLKIVFSNADIKNKALCVIVFALIMVAQVVCSTIITYGIFAEGWRHNICIIIGVLWGAVPFILGKIGLYQHSIITSFNELTDITYSQLIKHKECIREQVQKIADKKQSLNMNNINEIINDLPRHSSLRYVNDGSLTDEYFKTAFGSLKEPYIYIVLTNSKSAANGLIGAFTNKEYNHVSLAFDKELNTIVSYNGGGHITPPGLNYEFLSMLCSRPQASVLVYSLPAASEQKQIIIDKIKKINNDGSAYNLLGLMFRFSFKPNIMFCSQFVYTMLELAGISYFKKNPASVKPTDFVELDYHRRLNYICEISSDDSRTRENIL